MSEALNFVPPRVPLVDPRTGLITREWYLFLQGVFQRVGGANGQSTTDITNSLFEDAGSGETNSMLFALEQDYGQRTLSPEHPVVSNDQQPAFPENTKPVDDLTAEVAALREQVADLTTQLNGINQSTLL